MTSTVVILTTWPDAQQAQSAAHEWLEQGLVACVNILPEMTSLYIWEGQMQQGTEHQVIIKTRSENVARVKQAIAAIHPYECPEILVLKVDDGHEPYLNWITGQTA